ncbi:hypothetical protein Taro_056020 [Colocasia esculenta]|uniref:Uncharacterized protein n=1 Tax=Colocasia esculenta TaxID=4460 RepID=A0A843XVB4_COLES|nr:hypothetical protein [Colocasia esculenta]
MKPPTPLKPVGQWSSRAAAFGPAAAPLYPTQAPTQPPARHRFHSRRAPLDSEERLSDGQKFLRHLSDRVLGGGPCLQSRARASGMMPEESKRKDSHLRDGVGAGGGEEQTVFGCSSPPPTGPSIQIGLGKKYDILLLEEKVVFVLLRTHGTLVKDQMKIPETLYHVLSSSFPPTWASVIAGVFVLVSLSLSLFLIFEHLSAYKNPEEQKFLIGVILMVPCYAIESVSISQSQYVFFLLS